jgi:uncharacterized surface protein with fasciclin (FAS1) repeats
MKKFFLILLSVSLVSFSFIGCSDSSTMNPVSSDNSVTNLIEKRPGNGQTIVGIAVSDTNFTYLVAAVQFAGLVDVLNGNRQFTVFAPVNSAFEDLAVALNLPSVGDLLTEPYRELVTAVLLYHVSPGIKFSTNVVKSSRVNTLLEQFAFTKVENGMVKIGNDANGYANIVAVDIRATNGVIHVLDKVIIPILN